MLDVSLYAIRASKNQGFMWDCVVPFVTKLLDEGGSVSLKRTAIRISPHVPWWKFTGLKHLIELWAAAASVVPHTDEIGQSVVDALLQITSNDSLRPHVPIDMWSWLNRRPFLPPTCGAHYLGSTRDVVQAVRALGDVETLTSYLFLTWSEWGNPHSGGFDQMRASVREDFGGIGVGHHREDLLQRLDRILGQLDLGFEHLRQQKPTLEVDDIRWMKEQYGELREILLEVDRQVIDPERPDREFPRSAISFSLLTPPDRCGIPLGDRLCDSSPVSIVVSGPLHTSSLPLVVRLRYLRSPMELFHDSPLFLRPARSVVVTLKDDSPPGMIILVLRSWWRPWIFFYHSEFSISRLSIPRSTNSIGFPPSTSLAVAIASPVPTPKFETGRRAGKPLTLVIVLCHFCGWAFRYSGSRPRTATYPVGAHWGTVQLKRLSYTPTKPTIRSS